MSMFGQQGMIGGQDPQAMINNMRQFGAMFNMVTEECFSRCVYSLGDGALNADEGKCADDCISKNFNASNRTMINFMKEKLGQDPPKPEG
ncbi:mitochondrial import inner membrane translocase subunit Tim9-like [Bolinopsis microptera]|uniref:mitochondrial import inner membrane translocase subunit Tim9-like n=1 Tax=Bolinopsis microptera TaxID=2820187 RepID=UPI003079FF7F